MTIALKELIVETSKQILHKIGAKYTETRAYAKLLLTDLGDPQKPYQMISDKLSKINKITVRVCKRGIEITIDKEHYYDNFSKIVSTVARKIGDVLMDLEERYDYAVSYGKELY